VQNEEGANKNHARTTAITLLTSLGDDEDDFLRDGMI
jgi:hypothetical protein